MEFSKRVRHLAVVLAAGLGVGCAMDSVSTAPPLPNIDAHGSGNVRGEGGRKGKLLKCKPLQERTDEAMIGPAGGHLSMGPHRLEIPAGALTEMTFIRGEIRADSVNSVRLTPEGLRFVRPAVLTLKYDNCRMLLFGPQRRIAYTSDSLEIYYWLPSADHPRRNEISGLLDHFSRYAVGW